MRDERERERERKNDGGYIIAVNAIVACSSDKSRRNALRKYKISSVDRSSGMLVDSISAKRRMKRCACLRNTL